SPSHSCRISFIKLVDLITFWRRHSALTQLRRKSAAKTTIAAKNILWSESSHLAPLSLFLSGKYSVIPACLESARQRDVILDDIPREQVAIEEAMNTARKIIKISSEQLEKLGPSQNDVSPDCDCALIRPKTGFIWLRKANNALLSSA